MSDWPRANLEVAANIFKPSFKPRVLAATHTLKMRHRRNVKCGGDRWLRTIVSVDPRLVSLVNFEDQNCNQTIVLHRLYMWFAKLQSARCAAAFLERSVTCYGCRPREKMAAGTPAVTCQVHMPTRSLPITAFSIWLYHIISVQELHHLKSTRGITSLIQRFVSS